jgi:hypothetical protein
MVSPGDAYDGLPHQEVDHAVEARAPIAEVTRDDDLRDREVPDDVRRRAQQVDVAPGTDEGIDERVGERAPLLDATRRRELAEEAGERGRKRRSAWRSV